MNPKSWTNKKKTQIIKNEDIDYIVLVQQKKGFIFLCVKTIIIVQN